MTHPKLLIIGLDGATFDLILPWAKEGILPCFSDLISNGAWGNLQSTIPPITPTAWPSMATGKNPGKHGVFNFVGIKPDSYEFHFVNGSSIQGNTFWRILSDAGKKVGIINVPMTYPPEEINGYIISGLDTPDEKSGFTYPVSLYKEINKITEGYNLDIRHLGNLQNDRKRIQVLKELKEIEEKRLKALFYLMDNYPTDLIKIVFNATDQVQHHFWHYMDEEHPQFFSTGKNKHAKAIQIVYQQMDNIIARIREKLPQDTIIMLVSDHGAGYAGDIKLDINTFLWQNGLLSIKDTAPIRRIYSSSLKWIEQFFRTHLSHRQKAKIAKWFPLLLLKLTSSSLDFIDWSNTKAFASETTRTSGYIWINLKDKMPQGIVKQGKEYDKLIEDITSRLKELKNPETGEKLINKVFRKEEVFSGPYLPFAPDLIIPWWEKPYVQFSAENSFANDKSAISKGGFIPGVEFSGNHRLHGIFLMKGRSIKRGFEVMNARIEDIAPTVLYIFQQDIPLDMDGKILTEAFDEDFLEKYKPKFSSQSKAEEKSKSQFTYTEEEEEKVRKRLQGLGYIS